MTDGVLLTGRDLPQRIEGVMRFRERRVRVYPHPVLYCPAGHRLRDVRGALPESVVQCGAREHGVRCGRWVYVMADWTGSDRITLAAEVTFDEIQQFRQLPLVAKLEYLGLSLPSLR